MKILSLIHIFTTFIGRDQTKTVEENLELFEQVWKPLIALAEENQVKIGIEKIGRAHV